MADNLKKVLNFEGLKVYDEKIKAFAREIAAKVKADIIDGAPDAFDTLKEVSDYIATHKTEYDALEALVGDKAAKADLTTAVERIVALEASVTTLKADENTEGSVKHTAKEYADAVDVKVTTVETKVDAVGSKVDTLNGEEGLAGSVKNIAKSYADNVNTKVTTLSDTVDAVSTKATTNESNIATNTANIATNTSEITSLKTKVETLENSTVVAISAEEINSLFTTGE